MWLEQEVKIGKKNWETFGESCRNERKMKINKIQRKIYEKKK